MYQFWSEPVNHVLQKWWTPIPKLDQIEYLITSLTCGKSNSKKDSHFDENWDMLTSDQNGLQQLSNLDFMKDVLHTH